MTGVQHPNIVGLRTFKMAQTKSGNDHLWLVLNYCDKGTITVLPPPPHHTHTPPPTPHPTHRPFSTLKADSTMHRVCAFIQTYCNKGTLTPTPTPSLPPFSSTPRADTYPVLSLTNRNTGRLSFHLPLPWRPDRGLKRKGRKTRSASRRAEHNEEGTNWGGGWEGHT